MTGAKNGEDHSPDEVGGIHFPAHWRRLRAKHIFRCVQRPVRISDDIVTAFRDGQVTLRRNRREDGFMLAVKEVGYQGVRKGDLVIQEMDAFAGAIGVSDSDGKCSPEYSVCIPLHPQASTKFFAAYLRHAAQAGLIHVLGKGVRERAPRFRFSEFKELALPVPPYEEQHAIADFLDRKTAAIDELIQKKERLIEFLQERQQALVEQYIECPNARPVRLRWFADLLPGYAFPSDGFVQDGDGIRLLRGVNIAPGALRWEETVQWPRQDAPRLSRYLLEVGDLVLGMDRPWISDGIRLAEVTHADVPSLLLQRVARLRARTGLRQKYLRYLLSSHQFASYFEPILTGISVPHISPEQILGFRFRLPELDYQDKAIELLDHSAARARMLFERIRQQLDRLKEYRQALISAAVTGKLVLNATEAA